MSLARFVLFLVSVGVAAAGCRSPALDPGCDELSVAAADATLKAVALFDQAGVDTNRWWDSPTVDNPLAALATVDLFDGGRLDALIRQADQSACPDFARHVGLHLQRRLEADVLKVPVPDPVAAANIAIARGLAWTLLGQPDAAAGPPGLHPAFPVPPRAVIQETLIGEDQALAQWSLPCERSSCLVDVAAFYDRALFVPLFPEAWRSDRVGGQVTMNADGSIRTGHLQRSVRGGAWAGLLSMSSTGEEVAIVLDVERRADP